MVKCWRGTWKSGKEAWACITEKPHLSGHPLGVCRLGWRGRFISTPGLLCCAYSVNFFGRKLNIPKFTVFQDQRLSYLLVKCTALLSVSEVEPPSVSCTQALFMDIKVLKLSLNITPYGPSLAARIMGSCHGCRLQCEEQSTWYMIFFYLPHCFYRVYSLHPYSVFRGLKNYPH